MMKFYQREVCPECKIRNEDYSLKELHRCPLCGREFCAFHLDPKLAILSTDFRQLVKDREIRSLMEEEWKREDGHPCIPYTNKRIPELEYEKKLESKLIQEILDRSKAKQREKHNREEVPSSLVEGTEEKRADQKRVPKGQIPRRVGISCILLLLFVFATYYLYSGVSFQVIPQSSQQTVRYYTLDELVEYGLSLINKDRTKFGLSNVSLSQIKCGQMHADNMLKYQFFSHWDTNGYKPYMRYTLNGGKGSVAENNAWYYSNVAFDLKQAIKDLEWQMVYNDSRSDWGHRDNILNPFHNKVSIGIAYDECNLYLVQDFENDYVEWIEFFGVSENYDVSLSGTFKKNDLSIESISIFCDPLPSNLTAEQLSNPTYKGSYSQGTFIGMVVQEGYESPVGVTITAEKWVQTGKSFEIKFNLRIAFSSHGNGVYTLYLQPNPGLTSDFLACYSTWYVKP